MLFQTLRSGFARRSLETTLSEKITLAEEHKDSGLKPGHAYYKRLYNESLTAINGYISVFGGHREDIVMKVPKLQMLHDLADAEYDETSGKWGGFALIATLGIMALSAIAGLAHSVYLWTSHLGH